MSDAEGVRLRLQGWARQLVLVLVLLRLRLRRWGPSELMEGLLGSLEDCFGHQAQLSGEGGQAAERQDLLVQQRLEGSSGRCPSALNTLIVQPAD